MRYVLLTLLCLILASATAAQEPDTTFVELSSQRTYNSKTYYNPEENLYLTHVSPGYMHYRTAEGAYRDIDTRLRRDSTGVFLPEGLYRARFANLTGQAKRYDVTYEVARPVHEKFRSPVQRRPPSVRLQWKLLSFGYFDRLSYVYQILQNAEAAAPFVEGNQINYPQVFRGVTVRYTCGANRLKEEIVFSQAAREALPDPAQLGLAADHTYLVFAAEFTLSPNNLNALAHRTGGRDPIRTGNGFTFEGESRIDFEDERENLYFFFPHDYAWAVNDSVSEPVQVRRIFYSQEGKNHLLIGVPWRWVRAAAPGPLLIDPTIYNDYATDTRLQSATNVGSENTLMVGKKSGQVKKRTIIKFDLQYSSIPSNATVLNAQMQLYYFNATVAGGSAWVNRWVQAHELLNDWHESQADSLKRLTGVNWLAPRAKIGPGNNPITVDANGQFESTLLFQQGEHPTWKSWDLTNLTQKWVTTPSSNNGVILWATNEDVNAYDLRFYSSENETKQPELMIIWSDQPKTVYFLKDHLGSIRATVLDSAGAPVVAYSDYDPWGYILAKRDTAHAVLPAATRNKFTGKEWDDDYGVNWLFFPARSYDPEIARWMVRDPLEMKYPSWSPYVYTLDNPIKFLDPDGRGIWKPGSIVRFAIISFYMNNLMSWHNREAHDYTVFLEHIQGKSLSEVMHEADTRNNTLSYSAGGPFEAVKYIKDPAFPNRIIDMRHFLVVGQKGNLFGLGLEIGQALRLKDSGFNLEDFYSNFMGSLFFDYFFDSNSDKAFEEQLKEFFELWHKTYQEQRPEKEEQQKEDDKN